MDINGGLGKNVPNNLDRFRRLTENKVIVMGSKTFLGSPNNERTGITLVLTTNPNDTKFDAFADVPNVTVLTPERLFGEKHEQLLHEYVVIGGTQTINDLYAYITDFDVTIVKAEHECDRYFQHMNDLLTWSIARYEEFDDRIQVRFIRSI